MSYTEREEILQIIHKIVDGTTITDEQRRIFEHWKQQPSRKGHFVAVEPGSREEGLIASRIYAYPFTLKFFMRTLREGRREEYKQLYVTIFEFELAWGNTLSAEETEFFKELIFPSDFEQYFKSFTSSENEGLRENMRTRSVPWQM